MKIEGSCITKKPSPKVYMIRGSESAIDPINPLVYIQARNLLRQSFKKNPIYCMPFLRKAEQNKPLSLLVVSSHCLICLRILC